MRSDGNRAFSVLAACLMRLEDAPGDALGMPENTVAIVVRDGLVFPERRRTQLEDVFPYLLVRPHLLVERNREKRRKREIGVLEVPLVEPGASHRPDDAMKACSPSSS